MLLQDKQSRAEQPIQSNFVKESLRIEKNSPRIDSRKRILLIGAALMRRECLMHVIGERARDLVAESSTCIADAKSKPDLILLDLRSFDTDQAGFGKQAEELKLLAANIPVIIIADHDDRHFAAEAIRSGWRGFIPTSLAADMVIAAIRLVLAGGTFVPRTTIEHYVEIQHEPATFELPKEDIDHFDFTPREIEVLTQLRLGKPNKLIAYALNISESTVKVHLRNMMRKMNVTNRTQVAFHIGDGMSQRTARSA